MILTRCPKCATGFRVTTEQLKARGGRVRCGHCRTAFDALECLIDLTIASGAKPMPPRPASPPAPPMGLPAGDETAEAARDFAPQADEPGGPIATPAPEFSAVAEPITVVEQSVSQESLPDRTESVISAPAGPSVTATPAEQSLAPPAALPEELAVAPSPEQHGVPPSLQTQEDGAPPHEEPEAPATSLDELLPPASGRRSRAIGVIWGTAALLALLALAAQAVYVFRGELAHRVPEARPWLETACRHLDCRVPLPRFAELVSVESSELHPDSDNKKRLLLATTLKNRAAFAQAFPHLEITLTDTRDQAVVRRVFGPGEYLEAGTDIAAGFAANADRVVNLVLETSANGATGYRLYVFYP